MAADTATWPEGFDSYITGLREHAAPEALGRLCPGAPLRLRPGRGRGSWRLEVCTVQGEPLGWLPLEDCLAMSAADDHCDARVTALVPARMLPRVHIRVFAPG